MYRSHWCDWSRNDRSYGCYRIYRYNRCDWC